jgi:mercuric ion binding protein
MKKLLISFIILSAAAIGNVWANESVQVEVGGMVCSFCAQGLSKAFKYEPGVEDVKVSLEKHTLTLNVAEKNDLTDKKIKKLIEDSGYQVIDIKRNGNLKQ